jgi:hypothetical protein
MGLCMSPAVLDIFPCKLCMDIGRQQNGYSELPSSVLQRSFFLFEVSAICQDLTK